MAVKDAVGRYGERVAVRHLASAGWTVLARNWRSPVPECPGELDVVARDGPALVVVEVKTRRNPRCGTGVEAVTPAKLLRLRRLAGVWLWTNRDGDPPGEVRVDVVAVHLRSAGPPRLHHVRGVG
ncbi:MAG: YraN family protein [Kineosporiaceae bacterium]